MARINVNIKMDEDLKDQFEEFCNDVGMSMTTAFCIFAKATVRERCIPFVISSSIPNIDTIKAINDINNNIGLSRVFDTVDELMEDLNAED